MGILAFYGVLGLLCAVLLGYLGWQQRRSRRRGMHDSQLTDPRSLPRRSASGSSWTTTQSTSHDETLSPGRIDGDGRGRQP